MLYRGAIYLLDSSGALALKGTCKLISYRRLVASANRSEQRLRISFLAAHSNPNVASITHEGTFREIAFRDRRRHLPVG